MHYKIIAMIMANRLSAVLPRIISLNQGGFVASHLISENIALAQELVQHLSKHSCMAKAFNRVEWDYLLAILRAFGFVDSWISLIRNAISSIKFSVKIIGEQVGFFASSQGPR